MNKTYKSTFRIKLYDEKVACFTDQVINSLHWLEAGNSRGKRFAQLVKEPWNMKSTWKSTSLIFQTMLSIEEAAFIRNTRYWRKKYVWKENIQTKECYFSPEGENRLF